METEEDRLGIGSSTGARRRTEGLGLQLPWQRSLERSQARFRVHCIRQEVAQAQHECELARAKLSQRRSDLQERRDRLAKARALEAQDLTTASRLTTANTQLQQRLTTKTQLELHRQRVALLRALEEIYPIDLIPHDGSSNNFLFSISHIPLPSSELILSPAEKQDQETTSAALGLVAQLVTLLSAYLDTPIHYPLATAGSRSVVQDPISLMNGPRAFPLYSKSVEAYRFEYAIFLLNKDIEQLVNEHHVPLIDLRQTLPNLKNLINTIISASSPKAYASQSARRHISAKQIALLQSTSSSAKTSFAFNRHPSRATRAGGNSSNTSSPPHSVTNNHHHHHHLGKGHPPFSSASSTSSTSEQHQIQQRLQSNASVSLSIASAESSINSSEITLPGSGTNGLPHRRQQQQQQQQQLGSNQSNRRSVSSASAASTWAASLLGWKTFSPASHSPSGSSTPAAAAVIDDKAGDKNGDVADGDATGEGHHHAEHAHGVAVNGDDDDDDDVDAGQAEPPTVRTLGAGGSKKKMLL